MKIGIMAERHFEYETYCQDRYFTYEQRKPAWQKFKMLINL
jgi:hypothetical protein